MSKSQTYGYCRISRRTQNIERQVRNIKAAYPDAHIVQEAFTGTKMQGRKALDNLLKHLKTGDAVVFDSASRMSRNAAEAMELYEDLFNKGINLVFLKEHHIDTDVYRSARDNQIKLTTETGSGATDAFISAIVDALNRYTMDLAREQIKLVFDQAEKEVEDLHKRTSEGMLTARLNGKRIGQEKGAKLTTKKSVAAKEIIKRRSKHFSGTLDDAEVMKLAGISNNTLYKYKKELMWEYVQEEADNSDLSPWDIISKYDLNEKAYLRYRSKFIQQ